LETASRHYVGCEMLRSTVTFCVGIFLMTSAGTVVLAGDEKPKLADMEYVKMSTSMGDIYIELNRFKAPITVQNFLDYVDSGFYDATIFHRVINGFMIQGGGFTKDMNEKPTRPGIKNEWQNGLKNSRGTISMARRGGDPNSGTSQFFISVADNAKLDEKQRDGAAYAVFGKVIKGMEVVDKIKAVKTATVGPNGDVPTEPITITKVSRITGEDPAIKTDVAKSRLAAEHEAKRKADAEKNPWEAAMSLVREHNVDTTKGAKTPSGLWFTDVKVGTGASPSGPTANVKVHYTVWLVDGTQLDSSVAKGQPADFSLKDMIKGFTEGVVSMKVGGKRWLVVPGDLAWGAAGRPGIGPNAIVVFEVELIDLNK
jgi:peptidyl-prolyl cis-trans isomerase A (cyclophilin A)